MEFRLGSQTRDVQLSAGRVRAFTSPGCGIGHHRVAMGLWRNNGKRGPNGQRRTLPFEEPRWRLARPLTILKVDGLGGRHTLLGYAENISRNGLMIGTVSPKEVGSLHEIEFALPSPADLVVRCRCKVVWARRYSAGGREPGMGLEFLDLSASAAESIDSLWGDEHPPEAPATCTWSDFERAWVPWAPRRARPKGLSG